MANLNIDKDLNPKYSSIYTLIHSLSRGERKFFKINILKYNKGNLYKAIFEYLEKQKEFNDDELFNSIQYIAQVDKMTYRIEKSLLLRAILDLMRDYHGPDSSADMQIKTMISDASFLIEKGLFHLAQREIRNAKDLALANQRYVDLLTIVNLQISLAHLTNEVASGDSEELIKEIKLYSENVHGYLKNKIYHSLLFAMHTDYNSLRLAGEEINKKMKTVLKKLHRDELVSEIGVLNFQTKLIQQEYEIWLMNGAKQREAYLSLFNEIKSFLIGRNDGRLPQLSEQSHIELLENLLQTSFSGNADDIKFAQKVLSDAKFSSRLAQIQQEFLYHLYTFSHMKKEMMFKKGVAQNSIASFHEFLSKDGDVLTADQQIRSRYVIGRHLLYTYDFSGSLEWLLEVIEFNFGHVRSDMVAVCYALTCLAYYGLEDFRRLKNMTSRYERYFAKNMEEARLANGLPKSKIPKSFPENILIEFFKNVTKKTANRDDLKKKLILNIHTIQNIESPGNILKYFNYLIDWLEKLP